MTAAIPLTAWILAAYLAVLVAWAARRARTDTPFAEFAVAGRSQSAGAIALSLVATAVGGSATFGVSELAYASGPVAGLWLGAGAVGLALQALFIARPVRAFACHSLPEVAGRFVGRAGQRVIAVLIAAAWIGVVAAQLLGLGKILAAVFPGTGGHVAWVCAAAFAVTAYTALGGQRAVIRSDGFQAGVLFAALGGVLVWLNLGGVLGARAAVWEPWPPPSWSGWDMARLAVLSAGAFFIGPDIFTRNGSARDGRSARRAGLWAAPLIALTGLGVTAIGLWTRTNVAADVMGASGNSPFVHLLGGGLPEALTALLAMGLAGALLSSADTCLMGVATMLEVDVCGRNRTGWARIWVVAAGAAALAAALAGGDILGMLLMSYAVYVPGVAAPMAVAILGRKRALRPGRWLAGAAIGGVCGLSGEVMGFLGWLPDPWARPGLALAGTAISAVLAWSALDVRAKSISKAG